MIDSEHFIRSNIKFSVTCSMNDNLVLLNQSIEKKDKKYHIVKGEILQLLVPDVEG